MDSLTLKLFKSFRGLVFVHTAGQKGLNHASERFAQLANAVNTSRAPESAINTHIVITTVVCKLRALLRTGVYEVKSRSLIFETNDNFELKHVALSTLIDLWRGKMYQLDLIMYR